MFNSALTCSHRTLPAKRTYKKYERKLKCDYLRNQGDHVEYLKKKNPKKKKSYHFFRQRKENPQGPTIFIFLNHFKELSSSDSNTYSDQDFTFTEAEHVTFDEKTYRNEF